MSFNTKRSNFHINYEYQNLMSLSLKNMGKGNIVYINLTE
jgi:hypothetical protein